MNQNVVRQTSMNERKAKFESVENDILKSAPIPSIPKSCEATNEKEQVDVSEKLEILPARKIFENKNEQM